MIICFHCRLDRDMAVASLLDTMQRHEPPDQMVAWLVDRCLHCRKDVGQWFSAYVPELKVQGGA